MTRGPVYSEDEWIVLLYYFTNRPEATQTDSHEELIEFSRHFGRTASSMDASMRNIKAYIAGPGFSHGSSMMRSVVDNYYRHPTVLRNAAQAAIARINPRASLP